MGFKGRKNIWIQIESLGVLGLLIWSRGPNRQVGKVNKLF